MSVFTKRFVLDMQNFCRKKRLHLIFGKKPSVKFEDLVTKKSKISSSNGKSGIPDKNERKFFNEILNFT